VDNNQYPWCNNEMLDGWRPASDSGNHNRYLERLSTPVSYLTSPCMSDPFLPTGRRHDFDQGNPQGIYTDQNSDGDRIRILEYKYGAVKKDSGVSGSFANDFTEKPTAWIVFSSGPDKQYTAMESVMTMQPTDSNICSGLFYDPTNGTVSFGDIWRGGGQTWPGANLAGGEFFRQLLQNAK
jgi:hypothetical protein